MPDSTTQAAVQNDHPQDQAQAAAPAARGGTAVFDSMVPFMSLALTPEDKAAANEVLDSGILRQAGKCAELEERFGSMSGAAFAHTCANGTCALQLAYEALLERGDDVLVPSWTYIATASMLVARGCTPIFVDSLPDTYQVDIEDCKRRITPKTAAIAVTHIYGMPLDVDAVQAFAKEHGLKVIYDTAQAHLATSKGRGMGEFGDAVTYSFYATKNLGTGEGGMITTNDEELSKKIQLLRSHGETEKYVHDSIGFNYRMNDITAAIGCSRLDRLPAQTDRRRAIAARYIAGISAIEGVQPPVPTEGTDPAWHLFTCQLEIDSSTVDRDGFCAMLKAEGVPTAIHYPHQLTRQPAFADYSSYHPPVAEALSKRVFSLPIHHDLSDEQVDGIIAAVAKVAAATRTN